MRWITNLDIYSTSTTVTKGPPVTNAADCLQSGLKIHKMIQVPPSETRKVRHPENIDFVQHIDEEKKRVVRVQIAA